MAKINIPSKKSVDLLHFADVIYTANKAKGDASVLSPLDWDDTKLKIDEALAKNAEAESLRRESERLREERDALMIDIWKIVQRSRDILKGTFRGELRKLGDYGFIVDD